MTNTSSSFSHLVLRALVMAVLSVGIVGYADASKLHLKDIDKQAMNKPDIAVTLGKGVVFPLKGNVSDVMIANSGIAEVTPLKSGNIYVVGLTPGDTNIITVDPEGNVIGQYEVHVKYDTQAIQALVDRLFEDEKVSIDAIHDQIIITGEVSTPARASKIADLVNHYVTDLQDVEGPVDQWVGNLLTVRGNQQVMIRVKIAEVSRTILKELGIETRANDPNFLQSTNETFLFDPDIQQSRRFNVGSEVNAETGLTELPFAYLSGVLDTGINGIGSIEFLLNALENDNFANVLAEPNLTAISGEQAGFLAGGEFPVPTGQDQSGNITIEFKPFGVSLNFRPTVMSNDRISLQLDTEVSALDQENSVELEDVIIPGLSVRRAETTIELPSGGSMMIGGLLKSENVKGLNGLPGVMNTPIIGDLIKSDSFLRDESELIVLITAYMVEPFKDEDQVTPVEPERVNYLARTFEANMRRNYGRKVSDVFDEEDGTLGYLIH